MFIKVTTSGPRRYVQLVEAYRDDEGRPKQRTVATLGRLDQLNSELESVISGLLRVTGKTLPEPAPVPLSAMHSVNLDLEGLLAQAQGTLLNRVEKEGETFKLQI